MAFDFSILHMMNPHWQYDVTDLNVLQKESFNWNFCTWSHRGNDSQLLKRNVLAQHQAQLTTQPLGNLWRSLKKTSRGDHPLVSTISQSYYYKSSCMIMCKCSENHTTYVQTQMTKLSLTWTNLVLWQLMLQNCPISNKCAIVLLDSDGFEQIQDSSW